jgi:hypothetical protein
MHQTQTTSDYSYPFRTQLLHVVCHNGLQLQHVLLVVRVSPTPVGITATQHAPLDVSMHSPCISQQLLLFGAHRPCCAVL